MVALRR
jgi:putative (di)nucleoside polyphosphate hydrolase